jgi:hypothetical protein
MTRQTTEPLHDWRLNAGSAREARGLVTTMWEYFEFDPPYQRSSVWTLDQRIGLVRSWLMGVPIPAIIINSRDSPFWEDEEVLSPPLLYVVVDGKQRLETARMWFTNQFTVPASWFPADWVETTETTDDGPYVCYEGLTLVGRRFLHRWLLPMIEARLPTVLAEAQVYLLINNAGTAQTTEDLDRARALLAG